ncbi:unnamed protein product, partial [Penicillium discolor]
MGSSLGRGHPLDGSELLGQPEGGGPEGGQSLGRAHHRRRRDAEHPDPLTVAEALRGDGLGGLVIDDADEIGNDRDELSAAPCGEVLVLERDLERVVLGPQRRDDGPPLGEALGGPSLDVHHLPDAEFAHMR